MPRLLPTSEYLHERLRYEAHSGLLYWKPRSVLRYHDRCWNTRYAGRVAGSIFSNGYVYVLDKLLAHRVIWKMVTGEEPPEFLDHADTDSLNNRFENLRPATKAQNMSNRGLTKLSTSGFKGVYPHGSNWRSQIKVNGVLHQLGTYRTKDAAYQAYCKAADEFHREFAHT